MIHTHSAEKRCEPIPLESESADSQFITDMGYKDIRQEEGIDSSDKCMGHDDPPSRPFSLKHDILDKDNRQKTQRRINKYRPHDDYHSNKAVNRRASTEEKSEKNCLPETGTKSFTCKCDFQTIGCDGYCQIHRQTLNTLNKEVESIISETVTVTADGGPKTTEGRNLEGDSKSFDGGASVNENRPSEQGTPFQSNVTQNKKGHRRYLTYLCRSAVKPKSINSKRYGCFVLAFLLVCVPLAECVRGNPTHPTSDEDPMPSSLGEEIPLHLDNQIPAVIIETVDDREVNVQHPHNSAEQELGNPAGEPNLHDRMNGDNFVSYQPVEDPENTEFLASRLGQDNNRVFQRPDYSIRSFRSLDIASEQCRGAIHGQFTTIERRISSFRNWPSSKKTQSPRQLAAAGFYYEGESDITTCFCCDLRLTEWEPDDDPLMEHIRTRPECEYLRQIEQNRVVPERPTDFNNEHQHRQHEPRQPQAHGFSRLQEDPHLTCINNQQLPDYHTLTTSSVAQDFITMVSPQQLPREHVMNLRIQDIQARENELGHRDHAVSTQTDLHAHLATMGYGEERIQGVLGTPKNRDGKCTVLRDTESEARQERYGSHDGDSLERNLTTPSHGLPRDAEGGAESRPGHRQIQIHPQQEINYRNITHSDRCPESALDFPNLPMPEEINVSRRYFKTQDERESSTTSSSTLDDEERQALLEENRRLKECLNCKICLMKKAQCLIIPCGHLLCVVCFKCVRKCPFCRGCARAFLCIRRC